MMQPPLGDFSELPGAYVEIVEQPAPNANRFRYPSEGRLAGSIPGVNSTPENSRFLAFFRVPSLVEINAAVSFIFFFRNSPHNMG